MFCPRITKPQHEWTYIRILVLQLLVDNAHALQDPIRIRDKTRELETEIRQYMLHWLSSYLLQDVALIVVECLDVASINLH